MSRYAVDAHCLYLKLQVSRQPEISLARTNVSKLKGFGNFKAIQILFMILLVNVVRVKALFFVALSGNSSMLSLLTVAPRRLDLGI